MNERTDPGRDFAERLRQAVADDTPSRRPRSARRHRARAARPVGSSVANPRRVSYSDELFVERVRKALD